MAAQRPKPDATPLLDAAWASMLAKTEKCRQIAADRSEVLNSGLAANLEMPHPIFIDYGKGGHIWDADGNEYIDTSMGFGIHLLGHAHPDIAAAIADRAQKGTQFGIHSVDQMPLAELMVEAIPCAERVVFVNTGTEATFYAMRAARAYTGKEKIGLFDGFYHGAHDYGMTIIDPTSDRDHPTTLTMGHGIPRDVQKLTVPLPYNNAAALDIIRQRKDELAMVFVEGVQSSNPQKEIGPFLRELAQVCRDNGVLFGMDEVITGFRLAYGGAQELFNVVPDIATYGKIPGGGLPFGAIAGPAKIMNLFTGVASENGIFSGGTFSGNPLTMAAGRTMVTHLQQKRDTIYPYLNAQGDRLAKEINAFCREHQIPGQMKNAGSMFHMFFERHPVNSSRDITGEFIEAERAYYLHALNRGVLMPGTHRCFLVAAHHEEDVSTIIQVLKDSLMDTQADGFFN